MDFPRLFVVNICVVMASAQSVNLDLTFEETMKVINAFKKEGVLWNPHLFGFHNKQIKDEAWKLVSAEANIDIATCKRKLKSLTSSCRREKARIINSRRSADPGDVREPRWRYWNAFKFLRGLEDDDEDPLGTAPEMDLLDPTLELPALKAKLKRSKSVKTESTSQESISLIVATKLRKMYPDQRLYAENLINQTLQMGSLGQLTYHSKIRMPDFPTLADDQIPTSSMSRKTVICEMSVKNEPPTPDPLSNSVYSGSSSPESSGFESSDDIKQSNE